MDKAISATEPDWSRERKSAPGWHPWVPLLHSIRRYQYWQDRAGFLGSLIARLWICPYRFWSTICGAEIPLNTRLGGGLMLPHPNGIVIHPDAVIGPNCMVFQQVTIGVGGPLPGAPRIGGHVDIGAGAKILGGIVIGDHARIGANAVVVSDIPAGATAVGVPARIVESQPVTLVDRTSVPLSDGAPIPASARPAKGPVAAA